MVFFVLSVSVFSFAVYPVLWAVIVVPELCKSQDENCAVYESVSGCDLGSVDVQVCCGSRLVWTTMAANKVQALYGTPASFYFVHKLSLTHLSTDFMIYKTI